MLFRESLESILGKPPDAVAVVLMGFDGISVDEVTSSTYDIKSVGMEFSFILSQIRKATTILQAGRLEEVMIRSEQLIFLARVLDDEYFLGLALKAGAITGRGRYSLQLYSPEVTKQLR